MPDLDLAHEAYVTDGATHIGERLVISPCSGRFVPLPPKVFTSEGEWIEEGDAIAEIHTGREVIPVVSIFSGWVMGMLVVPGQPVQSGVALFRIRP
jgi:biotin carboxyl carrier protein